MKVAGVTLRFFFSWSITFKEAVSDLIFLTAKYVLHLLHKLFEWLLKIHKELFSLFPNCTETVYFKVSTHFLPVGLSFWAQGVGAR